MNQTDAISAAVGLLTLPQLAAQLPFRDQVHAAVLTKRLGARQSLRFLPFDGEPRVAIEDLKAFLAEGGTCHKIRESLHLPDETLSPVFGIGDSWFNEGPLAFEAKWWLDQLVGEVRKQMPQHVRNAAQGQLGPGGDASLFRVNESGVQDQMGGTLILPMPRWGMPTPTVPGTLTALPTPEMQRIISLPATGTPFKNMGEYHLATLLQKRAHDYIQQAVMATFIGTANPPLQQPLDGLNLLYNSAADYARVISAAMDNMEGSSAFAEQRVIDGFVILIKTQNVLLMQMSGTDRARLISLAF